MLCNKTKQKHPQKLTSGSHVSLLDDLWEGVAGHQGHVGLVELLDVVDGEVVVLGQLQQLAGHSLLPVRGAHYQREARPVEVQQQRQDGGGHLGRRGPGAGEGRVVLLVAHFVVRAFLKSVRVGGFGCVVGGVSDLGLY